MEAFLFEQTSSASSQSIPKPHLHKLLQSRMNFHQPAIPMLPRPCDGVDTVLLRHHPGVAPMGPDPHGSNTVAPP
jgi:hypothetical protein